MNQDWRFFKQKSEPTNKGNFWCEERWHPFIIYCIWQTPLTVKFTNNRQKKKKTFFLFAFSISWNLSSVNLFQELEMKERKEQKWMTTLANKSIDNWWNQIVWNQWWFLMICCHHFHVIYSHLPSTVNIFDISR